SVQHGFLLRGGQYTTIDDPAGVFGGGASGLNDRGQVSGFYLDANGASHGYVLSGGQHTTIDDPAGVLVNQANSINTVGQVVGAYADANGVIHGYLATPAHGDSANAPSTVGGHSESEPSPSSTDAPFDGLASKKHERLGVDGWWQDVS